MRWLKFLNGCLLFLIISQISYSQGEEVKIDPRQYVIVRYSKSQIQGKLDTIWNWETRKNVPNQKFRTLDANGTIQIDFNKLALIANKDFEGTISLEAEIDGTAIAVSPYSEVGAAKRTIGIKSEPPAVISNRLLNMLLELKDVDSVYDFLERAISFEKRILEVDTARSDIKAKIATIKEASTKPGSDKKKLIDEVNNLKKEEYIIKWVTEGDLEYYFGCETCITSVDSVTKALNKLNAEINRKDKKAREIIKNLDNKEFLLNALNYVKSKTEIILKYFEAFEAGGLDAKKAFFSMINKDIIGYNYMKDGLISREGKLNKINPDTVSLFKDAELVLDCIKYLTDLSNFEGSQLARTIKSFATRSGSKDSAYYVKFNNLPQKQLFPLLKTYFKEISDSITINVGRIIYKKLVYATIDLNKIGANGGKVLNLYVTWILNSDKDSLSVSESPRLEIGRYYLRKTTGFNTETTEMFALVKRINEDPSSPDPVNFKLSAGIVLMLTYTKEDKGISIIERNSHFIVRSKNKFLNFIEPSIGLNISYLDFTTDKDFEVGTGLQLGLFQNKVFFGYGVNLHMLSPSKQAPTYFYLGFSFSGIGESLNKKGKGKGQEN